ncbi:hypothetical protein [Burkholderia gladioli]|uniref:hypothetical protein n=1 Tax=Burkholderia gladioli TaxID=28095 RepID=UPI001640FE35|nr:hypothetical protein [Burkholderia gladioli]
MTYHYNDNHRCMIQHALARISASLAAGGARARRRCGGRRAEGWRVANRVRGEGAAGGAAPGA